MAALVLLLLKFHYTSCGKYITYFLLRCHAVGFVIISERSEPPSDKLGGEIFITSCALVCLSLYI